MSDAYVTTFWLMLIGGTLSIAVGIIVILRKSRLELRMLGAAHDAQRRRDDFGRSVGGQKGSRRGSAKSEVFAADLLSPVPRSGAINGAQSLTLQTWAVSRERDSYLDRRARGYISGVGGSFVTLGGLLWFRSTPYVDAAYERLLHILGGAIIAAGIGIIIHAWVPYLAARAAYRARRLALASARVDDAITKACADENPLQIQELFQLNRRQLDEYQLITRKQQKSAFLLAQVASVVAFAVLVGGVFIALGQTDDVDKYITGGLSALGTLLSGFLAATFFKSSKDANEQMNRYYLEPQRTGRLLAAERIVNSIPSATEQIRTDMITAVLGWEMPPYAVENQDDGKKESQESENEDMAGAGASSNGGTAGR